MRDPVTSDQLDVLVVRAGTSPGSGRRALAEQLQAWAEDPHPYDEPSPRELLTLAGEQLEKAGDEDGALTLYRRAVTSHGPVAVDPRCRIVAVLHRRGEHADADEVEHELRRSRPGSAATYTCMGRLCEERGETARALGWFNRGISLAEQDGLVEADMGELCLSRWQLRRRLGQDPDQFDEFGIDYAERISRAAEHLG